MIDEVTNIVKLIESSRNSNDRAIGFHQKQEEDDDKKKKTKNNKPQPKFV